MRGLSMLGVLVLLLSACGGEDPDPEVGEPERDTAHALALTVGQQEVEVPLPDGSESRALVHAPPAIDRGRPLPLVVVLHGEPGTPRDIQRTTGFDGLADEEGFLVAYPDALADAAELEALLDQLAEATEVDPRRIYVTGFSRGALTTYLLAADLADRIAAFAPVSGVQSGVEPNAPTSLIAIQGANDQGMSSSWGNVNRGWSAAAECERAETSPARLGELPARRTTAACRGGGAHVVYLVERMGHEWPRGTTRLVWDFFAAHPLG